MHSIPVRIYYEDTDSGGVVYHANYLRFCERGRSEFLRALGFGNKSLREGKGIFFVVRHIGADYLKTAHLDDLLSVKTSVKSLKNTSLVLKQDVHREAEWIFSADVTLVCVDANSYKPVRLPDDLKKGLEDHARNSP